MHIAKFYRSTFCNRSCVWSATVFRSQQIYPNEADFIDRCPNSVVSTVTFCTRPSPIVIQFSKPFIILVAFRWSVGQVGAGRGLSLQYSASTTESTWNAGYWRSVFNTCNIYLPGFEPQTSLTRGTCVNHLLPYCEKDGRNIVPYQGFFINEL